MTNIPQEQGSDSWLLFRQSKVTATDAAKILNISPYGSPYSLWLEKTGRKEPPKMNYAMEYGTRMEDEIRDWIEKKEGTWFPPEVVQSKVSPFMIASLDGISADRKTIIEIKTCGSSVFEEVSNGTIPLHYRAQGMHQLACVPEAEKVHFIFFCKGDYVEIDLFPDWEYISRMVESEKIFYELHILTDIPPAMSEKDMLDMSESEEWAVLATNAKLFHKEYQEEQARFKKFKDKWDIYKKEFIELSDDGNCEGFGIRLSRSWRTGNVDIEKMKADGLDVNKYLKSGYSTTKLSVLKEPS